MEQFPRRTIEAPKTSENAEREPKTRILSLEFEDGGYHAHGLLEVPSDFDLKKAEARYDEERGQESKRLLTEDGHHEWSSKFGHRTSIQQLDDFRDWLLKKGMAKEVVMEWYRRA